MKDMRREFFMGLITGGLFIVLNRFTSVPDLFLGLLMGLTLCFYMVGLLPEKIYTRLKTWKRAVIKL
jgi:hypothetical protein